MTNSCDSHVATLGAMGLFVSTALLSQILQYELERRRRERTTMALRNMYKTKRLSDRLSYTDLTAAAMTIPSRTAEVSFLRLDYSCRILEYCSA